jgi:hypothetical protein
MLVEGEAADVYGQLSGIARAHGLEWLIIDVESQIALGKQATRDIEVRDTFLTVDSHSSPQLRRHKASFVVTQPLTERERLFLLIEALEAASVGLSLGILNTYETLGAVNHGLQAIGFAPDAERARIAIVSSEILERKDTVVRLAILLKELKDSV